MEDFFGDLARGLIKAAKMPNVLSYVPNSETHQAFHTSDKIGRLLRGGNRSGKSVAGTVESVWRATGRHPYQKTHDLPIRGRIVTVDKDNGTDKIIKPLLAQWTPPSELVNGSWEDSWRAKGSTLTYRNGSTIEVMTHQQDTDAFAGIPLHFAWFDEEPPSAIFNECRLRLIDFNGCWYMTMTPVEGQDWIFDRFIVTKNKNVDMFEVDIRSNPHLNQEALTFLSEDLTDEEKEVREKGIFVPKGGLILKEFNYDRHITKAHGPIPRSWAIYVSIDHGYNNPTAILWHAVAPNGSVLTFKEHYKSKMLIEEHVRVINRINTELDIHPMMYMGDPSMAQKNGITGSSPLSEYRMKGIPLIQAKKDVAGRINKMNEYLKYNKWRITRDCPNTIKEIRGYSFKIYNSAKITDRNNKREEPNKKNDHAVDSAGYFFNFMPYLGPEERHVLNWVTNRTDFPWEVDNTFIQGEEQEDYAFGEG